MSPALNVDLSEINPLQNIRGQITLNPVCLVTVFHQVRGMYWGIITHLTRDKMAAILADDISNAFSWMKIKEFWFNFQFLSPVRRQTINWDNADPVHWRIYVELGGVGVGGGVGVAVK